jgi:hypothetical protein
VAGDDIEAADDAAGTDYIAEKRRLLNCFMSLACSRACLGVNEHPAILIVAGGCIIEDYASRAKI